MAHGQFPIVLYFANCELGFSPFVFAYKKRDPKLNLVRQFFNLITMQCSA